MSIWAGVLTAILILAAQPVAWAIGWHAARRARCRAAGFADHAASALAMTCPPCNGRPGGCHCPRRCGHPDCQAHDAVTGRFAAVIGEER